MEQGRVYHVEAIVVRRRDQGEADRVLTLCTPAGKLEAVAKGVRKMRSRKAGHVELFARTQLSLARSRSSWDVITQAETVEPNAALRGDLMRGSYARYVVELYDRFVADGEGSQALFDLLKRVLDYLGREERLDLLARAYEQRLLALVGFQPQLGRCVGEREGRPCDRVLDVAANGGEPFGLDPERGGALCPECFQNSRAQRGVTALSPNGLSLLRACQREPFARLRELPVTPSLMAEVEGAARHYVTYHLERDVRSGTFLRRLKQEGRK